jgi:hypothetical protein
LLLVGGACWVADLVAGAGVAGAAVFAAGAGALATAGAGAGVAAELEAGVVAGVTAGAAAPDASAFFERLDFLAVEAELAAVVPLFGASDEAVASEDDFLDLVLFFEDAADESLEVWAASAVSDFFERLFLVDLDDESAA